MTFSGVFWTLVVLFILSKLNISLSIAFLFLVIFTVIFKIYEYFDRKKNPKKWAKLDSEAKKREIDKEETERPRVAEEYWKEYQYATRRIPKSEWILMNREEKSSVFKSREGLKDHFYMLPLKTQEFIKKTYPIDINFPQSN
ncbi:MAG: hypothetical protein PHD43_16275 [Methylococcales bacterium]|nr:hypothetical protein [Methylococcales bacterium]